MRSARLKMPSSCKHQAHRMLYPLAMKQGGNEVCDWVTYTHIESEHMSHRATLAMDPSTVKNGQAPPEVLAALPLLLDVAMSISGSGRTHWTFESRLYNNLLEPENVVNYWPKAEVLETVLMALATATS
mmetsp:Transcript_88268/g.230284  ORF Transcript_88268/g.230284 Transcript_88268/m.230284 type:complete len:129 (-) Transcript_88268:312-698(-)